MNYLFGDLPDPSTKRDPPETNALEPATKRVKPTDALPVDIGIASVNDIEDLSGDSNDDSSGSDSDEQQHVAVEPAAPAPLQPQTETVNEPSDQVAAAINRITSHISSPKKFHKASELLRKLFTDGSIQPHHAPLVFNALYASMTNPSVANDPLLARDYSKLFTVVSRHADVFSRAERAQLDVYGLWAVVGNQLLTDDSFSFNKTVTLIKSMIEDLPVVADDDTQQLNNSSQAAVWSEEECLMNRRLALIDCLFIAKDCYKNAWARTSVDLLIEHAQKHSNRFIKGADQQARIEELGAFITEQKRIRRQGPSAKEAARDTTAFEKTSNEWSTAQWISKRGKVGNGGDNKSNNWLG